MRKIHLDNEVVEYRIHSDLVELRRNGKKTLVRHDKLRDALGLPQPTCEYCGESSCWTSDRLLGKDITPSMIKRYLQMAG